MVQKFRGFCLRIRAKEKGKKTGNGGRKTRMQNTGVRRQKTSGERKKEIPLTEHTKFTGK